MVTVAAVKDSFPDSSRNGGDKGPWAFGMVCLTGSMGMEFSLGLQEAHRVGDLHGQHPCSG